MLGKYFWDIYKDASDLDFHYHCQKAMRDGTAIHFDDFYPSMQAIT